MLRSFLDSGTSVPLLQFARFDHVSHGISTRHGGHSPRPYATLNLGMSTADEEGNILENRQVFARSLGIGMEDVVVGRLTHGRDVSVFHSNGRRQVRQQEAVRPGSEVIEKVFRTDAAVSDVPGLHFLLTFADCVPLLFRDRQRNVIGAAHAGWRGTAQGIGLEVIRAMQRTWGTDPSDVEIGIGPSIGPCCYSVGDDVGNTFRTYGHEPVFDHRDGVNYLDLWETNERQLRAAGVPADAIENPRICTSCEVDTFYSHRAERGRTGRFALLIGAP